MASTLLTGCGGGECGEGTVRHQNTCLPFDPFDKTPPMITVDPPVRTRAVGNVRLTSNEPAEIYVTIDDTTPTLDSTNEPDQLVIPNDRNDIIVRFFAVDLAGNQSAEQIVLWNIDDQGPAPPTEVKLTTTGASRTLTWRPPQSETHLGGVLVARVEGRLSAQPTNGTKYATGDEIAPGITVVDVTDNSAATATFTESLASPPGLVRYAVWAFDDLFNYGVPSGAFAATPIAQQKPKLVLDPTDNSVSTAIAAPNLAFSGNTTFSGGTLTSKLTMRNDSTRVLFAPKAVLTTTLANGVALSNPDGTIDIGAGPQPFRAYGGAIPPGGNVTVTWTFTGVTNTALTVDLDIRDGNVLVSGVSANTLGGSLLDIAAGREADTLNAGPGGTRGRFFSAGGGITPDGLAIFGSHSSGTLSSWDLTTGNRLQVAELRPQKAHIAFATLDASGSHGYALLADGHARQTYRSAPGSADTDLIRFDAATLSVQGTLKLGQSRNRDIRMTTDNKYLVVASGIATTGAILVDLDTFKIAHNLVTGSKPEDAVFAPDNVTIAVVSAQDVQLFDARDGNHLKTIPLPAGPISKMMKVAFNGNGELWVGRRDQLIKFDLTTETVPVGTTFDFRGRLLEVFDGKIYAGDSNLEQLAPDGTQLNTFSLNSQRGHWLGRSPF